MSFNDVMIDAIQRKKIVKLIFNSYEKGEIVRMCIPFDIGPSRRYKDGVDRFHFYDLDSPDGEHNLSILPGQIINIDILSEGFEPKDYVKWTPNWFIKRDWGIYS